MTNNQRKAQQHASKAKKAAETAGLEIIASSIWKALRKADTKHEELAEIAASVGFPAIFLPEKQTAEKAIAEAVRSAPRSLPKSFGKNKWKIDRLAEECNDTELVFLAQEEDPARYNEFGDRLWTPRFKIHLIRPQQDDVTVYSEAELFFNPDFKEVCEEPVTDLVLDSYGLDNDQLQCALAMQGRVLSQYDRFLNWATAKEIGKAADDALRSVGGLKVIPSKWILPGDAGNKRAEEVAAFLNGCGESKAGVDPYVALPAYFDKVNSMATEGIFSEIEDLVGQITDDTKEPNTSITVLRNRLNDVRGLERRISGYVDLVSGSWGDVKTQLANARKLLDMAFNQSETKAESLSVSLSEGVKDELLESLKAFKEAANEKDPESLTVAVTDLVEARSAARNQTFQRLWKKLYKKASATITSSSDNGIEDFEFEALAAAASDVGNNISVALDDLDFANL